MTDLVIVARRARGKGLRSRKAKARKSALTRRAHEAAAVEPERQTQ